jgi:hypothetical protein
MPSPDIVQNIRTQIQQHILPATPARWRRQLDFGLQAYGLKAFRSLTGNARMTNKNPHTGIRKGERLLTNEKLAKQLGTIFDSLGCVKPSSYVNVDHSDVDGLTALVGAVQTRNGRAIPCFVETTYAHHIPASGSVRSTPRWQTLRAARAVERQRQSFTGHTIAALQALHDRLGFWPKLVFDRGFSSESMVTHLVAEGATFYVRLKAGRYVELSDGTVVTKLHVRNLGQADATIQLFGMTLRVIRSPKGRRSAEPWYILTNDMTKTRDSIVRIYYHRFEIEETFKDMKHIFELKRARLQKPLSLKLLLWFVAFGITLLYTVTMPRKQQRRHTHPKKQTSWLRQAYEQLQSASGRLLWGEG